MTEEKKMSLVLSFIRGHKRATEDEIQRATKLGLKDYTLALYAAFDAGLLIKERDKNDPLIIHWSIKEGQ